MKFPFKIICKSEEDTKNLAELFYLILKKNDVVVLNGNLGSGKTFFVRSILSNFAFEDVTSPTFAIVNEYLTEPKIYHFDFYRINTKEELLQIGFEDYLNDYDSITFIEWGEMFPDILPNNKYVVNFKIIENNEREILIEKYE